ncbi:GGDEF domain-containing protein [Butyrivibrio sp. AD3002]|uniref:GGDEF domain-containing protein n=1 Tax=Butyrivibrio sp. AD3002 TaxID=1280670 RepID=UPI00047C20E8|nr:GGDEF domain-containing protein [Butyrivibrio sp. AD3002]
MDKNNQNLNSSRVYNDITEDGDYFTQKQYMMIAISFLITHVFFEGFYIWLSCTPMIYLNIVSMLVYVVSIFIIRSGNTLRSVWFMALEVYFHIILATVFVGIKSGFQLWLFGTFASIFLPYFMPYMSSKQRRQIGNFSIIVVLTFLMLHVCADLKMFPTTYNPDERMARVLYCINALIGFGAITLYTAVYNQSMAHKNEELRRLADYDFLTEIYNRQRVQRILDKELQRKNETDENDLFVAILDIDFFKNINDTYGHIAGDNMLKQLAGIFKKNSSKGFIYGRWGGEEFLLIAPEDISYEEFGSLLEDIRSQVEETSFREDGRDLKITVSIGAAAYRDGMTAEELVNLADERLYIAKEGGRNKVVVNSREIETKVRMQEGER